MNATQRRVHDILAAAAARGAPCPTNSEIGDACGMMPTSCGGTVLQLRNLGIIHIHSLHKARQVTIVATGATTAAIDAVPHWRVRECRARTSIPESTNRRASHDGTVLSTR